MGGGGNPKGLKVNHRPMDLIILIPVARMSLWK